MRRYHVVAFTRDLARVLAIRTPAGWLLPRLDGDARIDLPLQLHAALSRIVAEVEVIHEALLAADAPAAVYHGYCAALVTMPVRHADISAVPVQELLSQPALVRLQRQALQTALSRLRSPVAPFDSADRVNAALAWGKERIAGHAGGTISSVVRHRCTRHEYSVRFRTTAETFHFKGGRDRVRDEAPLTDMLHVFSPEQFPKTVALDSADCRWLYRELPGHVMMGRFLNPNTASAAAKAYAGLQKRIRSNAAVENHLAHRRIGALDLFERVDAILRNAPLQPDAMEDDGRIFEEWRVAGAVVADMCARIDAWRLPMTLALSDFWPGNVVVTGEGFGLIDLEYSFWSYPFLSLWLFSNDAERFLRAGGLVRRAIEEAYAAEWADVIPAADMIRALEHLPMLGRLLRVLVESRRLDLREQGLGIDLPKWYRAAYLAPFVRSCLERSTRSTALAT